MKHTPGPWEIGAGFNGLPSVRKMTGENSGVMLFEAYFGLNSSKEEGIANAILIAAAPDMLETLQKIESIYNNFTTDFIEVAEIREMISAVLKKARGE